MQNDYKVNEKYQQRLTEVFDFNILERNTPEYRDFIQKLEKNYASQSSKACVCLLCWAFLPSHLKKRHMEHEPYIVTASFFKNEECFIKLCKENGKCSSNGTRVIVFKEACNFSVGPQASQPKMEMQCFAGGSNPIHDIGSINKKQFEFDFQIKRLNAVAANI